MVEVIDDIVLNGHSSVKMDNGTIINCHQNKDGLWSFYIDGYKYTHYINLSKSEQEEIKNALRNYFVKNINKIIP